MVKEDSQLMMLISLFILFDDHTKLHPNIVSQQQYIYAYKTSWE